MILDKLENARNYLGAHPLFNKAFDFLGRPGTISLQAGRHTIQEDDLFAVVVRDMGKGMEKVKLEVHRQYADIQVAIQGTDWIGWRPAAECSAPDNDFDTAKDLGFFLDSPQFWFPLAPRFFSIFYPQNANAVMGGKGDLHKIIIKVRL